jgi:multicomponent Na+:H+ antiporter subunit D
MALPAAVLAVVGLGLAFAPDLAGETIARARALVDRPAHAREVLRGIAPPPIATPGYSPSLTAYAYGAACTAAALAFAGFGLYRQRVPETLRRAAARTAVPGVDVLKSLHSGAIGDYVTWLVVGVATLGGVLTLALR